MKKTICILSVVFLASGSQALQQIKIACSDSVEGYLVTAAFDSSAPVFTSKMVIDPQTTTENQYVGVSKVCGVNLDFTANCKGEIKGFQNDAGYTFSCNNGIGGEIVLNANQLSFSCSGPGVTDDFKNLIFTGCKATN